MPRSRNRPGHQYQKPSDIPSKQRTKGRITWGILFAIFGVTVAYFAGGDAITVLIIAGVVSFFLGYLVGKSMEKDAKKST